MLTNTLKKGDMVLLRSGWRAELLDNCKGNTRTCKVWGWYTECGSVYAHDIVGKIVRQSDFTGGVSVFGTVKPTGADEDGEPWVIVDLIDYTPAQLKLRRQVEAWV